MRLSVPLLALAVLLSGSVAQAQQTFSRSQPPTPEPAARPNQGQPAGAATVQGARRFRIGLQGGVGLHPELVNVGVHADIGKIVTERLSFRPGLEIGLGEITTLLNINLDVLYALKEETGSTRWIPYAGAGPAFGWSHEGVSATDVDDPDVTDEVEDRFDFSDTDSTTGMNFIFGVRRASGLFVEIKATAWGNSNIWLLAGFSF
jgi:hypothetical protein